MHWTSFQGQEHIQEHAKLQNVVVHPLVTIHIKIVVEWCLYLVAGDIEIIWHCKCVCNTILKICSIVDDHFAHQEQCLSIQKPCCSSAST